MIRRSGAWLVAATVFMLVNAGGGVYAAIMREPIHAAVHGLLTLVGLYAMYRISQSRTGQPATSLPLESARIDSLQQSVDAVALEVERIGEAQRFDAKIRAERRDAPQ